MNKGLKKRIEKLKEKANPDVSLIIFMHHFEHNRYEVSYQDHSKDFTSHVAVYETKEEAEKAIKKLEQKWKGEHIIFWDDIDGWNDVESRT